MFDFYRGLRQSQYGEVSPEYFESLMREHKFSSMRQENYKQVYSSHSKGITSLALDTVENRYLLSSGYDGEIGIYDVSERTTSQLGSTLGFHARSMSVEFPNEYKWGAYHKGPVSIVGWYPFDTGLFFSGGIDKKLILWDTNELSPFLTFDLMGNILTASMSPLLSAQMLIAVGTLNEYNIRMCDIRTGAHVHILVGHSGCVNSTEWSKTSEYHLASGSNDGTIRLWDIRRPSALMVLDQHNDSKASLVPQVSTKPTTARSHGGPVMQVRYSPDGLHLVSYGLDRKLNMWDMSTGKNTFRNFGMTEIPMKPYRFCFSPDGQYIFSPSGKVLRLLHTHTGQVKSILRGHFDTINSVVCNYDTCDVFSGGNDGLLCTWTSSFS